MYAYDPKSSSCTRFSYSGCGGNGNRFFTKSSCQQICILKKASQGLPTSGVASPWLKISCGKPDTKPKSASQCDAKSKNVTFYYYDKTNDSCKMDFSCWNEIGGGKFRTKSSCEALCLLSARQDLDPAQCLLPPQEGPCGGKIRRYYYNINERKCQTFHFGGCRGNGNNFGAKADCEAACKGSETKVIASFLKAMCGLPVSKGTCSRNFRRFYFDNSTNTCREFEYTGCGGNENRVRASLSK